MQRAWRGWAGSRGVPPLPLGWPPCQRPHLVDSHPSAQGKTTVTPECPPLAPPPPLSLGGASHAPPTLKDLWAAPSRPPPRPPFSLGSWSFAVVSLLRQPLLSPLPGHSPTSFTNSHKSMAFCCMGNKICILGRIPLSGPGRGFTPTSLPRLHRPPSGHVSPLAGRVRELALPRRSGPGQGWRVLPLPVCPLLPLLFYPYQSALWPGCCVGLFL